MRGRQRVKRRAGLARKPQSALRDALLEHGVRLQLMAGEARKEVAEVADRLLAALQHEEAAAGLVEGEGDERRAGVVQRQTPERL